MSTETHFTESGSSPPSLDARIAETLRQLADLFSERDAQASAVVNPHRDNFVRIKEACKRMGWTYSWAVKHWTQVGGFKDADGALKIRSSILTSRL